MPANAKDRRPLQSIPVSRGFRYPLIHGTFLIEVSALSPIEMIKSVRERPLVTASLSGPAGKLENFQSLLFGP